MLKNVKFYDLLDKSFLLPYSGKIAKFHTCRSCDHHITISKLPMNIIDSCGSVRGY